MTLGEKQRKFPLLLMSLIHYIYGKGYEATWGDGYRDPRVFGNIGDKIGYGHKNSCHKLKLAQDLNLFDPDGKYITDSSHPFYAELGEYWESLHEDCRAGIRFNDANHFSITHKGMM